MSTRTCGPDGWRTFGKFALWVVALIATVVTASVFEWLAGPDIARVVYRMALMGTLGVWIAAWLEKA